MDIGAIRVGDVVIDIEGDCGVVDNSDNTERHVMVSYAGYGWRIRLLASEISKHIPASEFESIEQRDGFVRAMNKLGR